MDQEKDLIGGWKLHSFRTVFGDGSVLLPYGPNADGRIIYSADGLMAAHLWNTDLHIPGSASGGDPAYFSYCGAWSVEGDVVHHRVHAATDPGWTGQDKLRTVAWSDNALHLIAEGVVFEGRTGRGELTWVRNDE